MSAPRDALPSDEMRTQYDEAWDRWRRAFAAARRKRHELYAAGGAEAVAREYQVPGGPSAGELAEGYERLAEQARERRRAA